MERKRINHSQRLRLKTKKTKKKVDSKLFSNSNFGNELYLIEALLISKIQYDWHLVFDVFPF